MIILFVYFAISNNAKLPGAFSQFPDYPGRRSGEARRTVANKKAFAQLFKYFIERET